MSKRIVDFAGLPQDIRRKIEQYYGPVALSKGLSVEVAFKGWWRLSDPQSWGAAVRALDAIRAAAGESHGNAELDELPIGSYLYRPAKNDWRVSRFGDPVDYRGTTAAEAIRAALGKGEAEPK